MPASREDIDSPDRIRRICSLLKLVTSPTRAHILDLLADAEKNVGEIREALGSPSQASVSHQLALLRRGRLVEAFYGGRFTYYSLTEGGRDLARACSAVIGIPMSGAKDEPTA